MTRAGKFSIAINTACFGLVAWLSSNTWAPEGAESMTPAGFDVMLWVLVALPLTAVALVTNIIWFVRFIRNRRRSVTTHMGQEGACLLLIGMAWGVLVVVDHVCGYRGSL
ncbi:hypothetical protein [Luteibacter aegosomatissinici]|uniref:hypothetical protein n=1 Tax=Luteibacter aegosomatissinici TaxID=2911539 RepID=UPI001FFA1A76|nr:hypothetical protein [Luteibacter aegosomatissinici]UPG93763.1 hypothetical protein L2Y97_18270 [Luteibacter aegosomatissinici]